MVMRKSWSRRDVVGTGLGAAALGLAGKLAGAQQMPAPQPLEDDSVRLVTTTAESAWQKGVVYKPAFGWDLLNLNVGAASGAADAGVWWLLQ